MYAFSRVTTHDTAMSTCFLFLPLLLLTSFTTPSFSSSEAFIYGSCSQAKITPGSAYESAVNSFLTSIINAAKFSSYSTLTIPSPSQGYGPIYGLFQCRGNLAGADCSHCVSEAVSQLGTLCHDFTGGTLQLDGCYIRYDNSKFFGVGDKTLMLKKCGPSIGFTSDLLTRRDAVLAYLETSDGMYTAFRATSSGNIQAMAQCLGDLTPAEGQDCISNAIRLLQIECGSAQWGRIYLAKCYAVYSSEGGDRSANGNGESVRERESRNNDEPLRTLLIISVLIVAVTVLIAIFWFLAKKGILVKVEGVVPVKMEGVVPVKAEEVVPVTVEGVVPVHVLKW